MKQQTIGIIGLGSFGQFAASILSKHTNVRILGFDTAASKVSGVEHVDLATVAQADNIILAIPLSAYPTMLPKLAAMVRPETLIIDVCSVKVHPAEQFARHLPNHPNILLTHPLFGSQSASVSTNGHVLVVTGSTGQKADHILAFCEQQLGLAIHHMSNEQHDKIMARIHVLTFFVARSLSAIDDTEIPFMTPSYKMIEDLVTFDRTHSDELFQTIQQGNPFAEEMRQQVVDSFAAVAEGLRQTSAGKR